MAERRAAKRRSPTTQRTTQAELDVTEQLVAALYANMDDAGAVQAAEPALLRGGQLQRDRAPAGPAAISRPASCSPRIPRSVRSWRRARPWRSTRGRNRAQRALESRIDRAIEPFDAAGLRDRSRRDWYPVLASDLLESAGRFKTTPDDIVERLPYLFAVPR